MKTLQFVLLRKAAGGGERSFFYYVFIIFIMLVRPTVRILTRNLLAFYVLKSFARKIYPA